MRPWIFLLWTILISCEAVQASTAIEVDRPLPPAPSNDAIRPLFGPARSSTDLPKPKPKPKAATIVPDPYEGWQEWCEPLELTSCKTDLDCGTIAHPANKPMKCVRPWYAKAGSDTRVCSPGHASRIERDHQRARLRELVRLQYGEAAACEPGSTASASECQRAKRRGDRLGNLLTMVAHRETTMRRWKRHRLNGDIRANRIAWDRTAKYYGHGYEKTKEETGDAVRYKPEGNDHFAQRWRWRYGIGLYGMNAAYYTRAWDPMAPPEVLCREVEATEAYLRSARRGWRKLSGGVDCDGKPGKEWHGVGGSPTLYDVHHYSSGGKLCPSALSRARFESSASKAGLEPYAVLQLSDLGTPIEVETQNKTAALRTAQLDAFSAEWAQKTE